MLVRGEMQIHRDNSHKRLIAALIHPSIAQRKNASVVEELTANQLNNALHTTSYKMRNIQTPVVDKLDP